MTAAIAGIFGAFIITKTINNQGSFSRKRRRDLPPLTLPVLKLVRELLTVPRRGGEAARRLSVPTEVPVGRRPVVQRLVPSFGVVKPKISV